MKINLVQHGHTPLEQLVYAAMWNAGGTVTTAQSDAFRDVAIREGTLGKLTGLKDAIYSVLAAPQSHQGLDRIVSPLEGV